MSTFLSQLNWRHATKSFDTNNPLSDAQIDQVLNAIHMAPTSFGLQPFYVRVVKSEAIKKQLCQAGWNQSQFETASAVLVFVARTDAFARIDQYFTKVSGGNAEVRAGFKMYEDMMKGAFAENNLERIKSWAQKQCYIALGFALAACAELEIDSCPMEGFSPETFDKILAVPAGEFSTVVLTIGRRAAGSKPFPKMRFDKSDLFRKE